MAHKRIILLLEPDARRRVAAASHVVAAGHAAVVATSPEDLVARLGECAPDAVAFPPDGLPETAQAAVAASAVPWFTAAGSGSRRPAGEIPWPLDRAAVEVILREVSARAAVAFAAEALGLGLHDLQPVARPVAAAASDPPALLGPPPVDEPTALTGPEETAAIAAELASTDPATSVSSSDEGAFHEHTPPEGTPAAKVDAVSGDDQPAPAASPRSPEERTNVGDEPPGLAGALDGAPPAPQDGVFAEGDAPAAPAAPAREPEDTDATRQAPRIPDAAAALPTAETVDPAAPLPVAERAPTPPGKALPRILKLDTPPAPSAYAPSGTSTPGATSLDESVLGSADTATLCDLHARLATANAYDVLGVARTATGDELLDAFSRLSRMFHPDRTVLLGGGPLKDAVRTVYLGVTRAYAQVRDPAERAAYDARLHDAPAPSAAPAEDAPAEDDSESAFASTPAPQKATAAAPAAPPPPALSRAPKPASEPPPRPSVMLDLDAPSASTPPRRESAAEDASGFDGPSPSGIRSALRESASMKLVAGQPRSVSKPRQAATPTHTSATTVGLNPLLLAQSKAEADAGPGPLQENAANTPGGRKFVRLAVQAMGRNDFNGARLNLTFALGYEPENAALKEHLSEVEGRLSKPPR